jgi:hypothetical protein
MQAQIEKGVVLQMESGLVKWEVLAITAEQFEQ